MKVLLYQVCEERSTRIHASRHYKCAHIMICNLIMCYNAHLALQETYVATNQKDYIDCLRPRDVRSTSKSSQP